MGRVASDQVYPMKFKLSSLSCQKIGSSLHLLSNHMVPYPHTSKRIASSSLTILMLNLGSPYICTLYCKTTREVFSKDLLTRPP